ncbi:MAG: hypothetical protein DRH17_10290 [Deltaproteobacteria bacterium]|nr:MAG: hypothetical protein DRH17_10290 [Deltaproteobacteria bacterium]
MIRTSIFPFAEKDHGYPGCGETYATRGPRGLPMLSLAKIETRKKGLILFCEMSPFRFLKCVVIKFRD